MTNSSSITTNTILVAALLLSSGVCLTADAFSTASLLLRQIASQRNNHHALFYAPKGTNNGLEAQGPKRRRGRPRKTNSPASSSSSSPRSSSGSSSGMGKGGGSRSGTVAVAAKPKKKATSSGSSSSSSRSEESRTTTTATAATATTTVDLGGVTKIKRTLRTEKGTIEATNLVIKKTKRRRKTGVLDVTSMLDHELLTKEEEALLGKQVQRAIQLEKTMAAWIAQHKSNLYETAETKGGNDDEDDDEDDYYLSNNNDMQAVTSFDEERDYINDMVYGTPHGKATERYEREGGPLEELFYQDGTPFSVEDDFGMSFEMSEYSIPPPQQQQSPPDSWLGDVLLAREGETSPSSASSSSALLTDDDVRKALDLPGGRSQLRAILLDGALARQQLMQKNVKLVLSIATKWSGQPLDTKDVRIISAYSSGRPTLNEAIQEGIFGLSEAAKRYDPSKGYRFSTFAHVWVTNFVRKCFQSESTPGIRLPAQYYEVKREYVNRMQYYKSRPGQQVLSIEVLAGECDVTVSRLTKILQWTQPIQSMDHALGSISHSETDVGYTLMSKLAW